MKTAMNSVATYSVSKFSRGFCVLAVLALAGCALPSLPQRPAVYDFGPGPLTRPAVIDAPRLAPLVVSEVEANAALDGTAVLYRLAYADDQQLHPYAQARWSMTPAQLIRLRLREHLGQRRALLNPEDGAQSGVPSQPATLRVELEEFSQLFEAPDKSVGLLRLRATLTRASVTGPKLVAQHSVIMQRSAPSADAAGGVRAMTAATDAAVLELAQWLQEIHELDH
jgi:cholesterol transport system auxiliary component